MAVHRKLLIVEGKDDYHVMLALRQKFGMEDIYEISPRGNKEESENVDTLLTSILVEAKKSGQESLGVVIDRDTADPNKNKDRWQQIKNRLSPLGYAMPEFAPADGAILPSPELGLSKIGIWLMPDNQTPGMLEDFMRLLVPENDECLVFAEKTLQALEEKEIQRYKEVHRSKALIHTWIAWQDKPGIPLGQSTTRYLDIDTKLCQQFASWLNELFNETQDETN
ncbi:DUF3226 domain-containing protein [Tunicatimonas pelagia]|uniref:DUF3226 domain-containing protein n=1 Tax=Tunicatimonas pelagia TaxID=931531 RepID=UPI00266670F7|nr:DUF3226 domain-containing protein [Tunicatimonas pelagia]WKN40645.1 hypothetical protein P0M28_16525 [Tunicatimonas pelagia]